MFDLELTQEGDIVIQQDTSHKNVTLELCFTLQHTQPIMISFAISHTIPFSQPISTLGFSIGSNKEECFSGALLKNERAIKQMAICLLKTSLKELRHDLNYGSKLDLLRKAALPEILLCSKAEQYAKEALKDFLPSASIKVKLIKNKTGLCQLAYTVTQHSYSFDWKE